MANVTEEIEPPTPLLSDYIEILYLSVMVIIGTPLNVIILRRLLAELKKTPRDSVKSGFLLLKINLNISDILLLIMAFGKIIWLYTYEWKFGDFPCRIYQFLSMFALYISSNIVVCIAIDRLRNVIYANKVQRAHKHVNPVKLILVLSWIVAFLSSVPQFFFFQTVNVAPFWPNGWYQCTDIWKIFGTEGEGPFHPAIMTDTAQNTYNISHLIIVFWGPAAVMMISYAVIATKLMQYSLRGVQAKTDSVKKSQFDEESSVVVATANDVLLEPQPENTLWNKIKNAPLVDYARRHSHFTLPSRRTSAAVIPNVPKLPTWRRQLRSKVFRTTLLVVLAHIVFWFPYNSLALMKYINEPLYRNLSDHANIFKDLQIIITLINPFLYGFT